MISTGSGTGGGRRNYGLRWLFYVYSLFALMEMSACTMVGALPFGGDSWKEEVLLHDGSKLMITRSQTYGGRHEIGQPPPIKEHKVTFTLPQTTKTIIWTSEYGEDLGRTNFHLLAVHVLNGTPYIVAEPNLCLSYNKWGRPNPPYVLFKYDGIAWQRITLEVFPAEFTTTNVALGLSRQFVDVMVKQGVVSVEQVQKQNSQLPNPEYKVLLRRPYQGAEGECSEMIRTIDGWEGLGFFKHQPSYEACVKYCARKGVSEQNCPCETFFNGR